MLARHDLIRTNLLLYANNLPLHHAILLISLSRTGWRSSLLSLSNCKGTPKYFMGSYPIGQLRIWAIS
jgi:hypothetical protein